MTIATPRRFRRAMPPMVLMAAVTCSAFAQPGIESAPLDLREAVERSLETGDVHSYTFELDESQFVYLVANQKTVDVKVTVYNPAGETVGVYDGPARGPESVQFFSQDAGVYRVEVTPFESEQGEYVIELRRAEAKATTPEGLVGQMIAPYDDPHTPGGVVAVVRDGEIIFAETFGAASLRYEIPFEADTRTNIGSTSKQFTAFAIALLDKRGELSLDDDVRKHIPELPDFGETVTLRHLLTHTSGYREFLNALFMSGRRLDLGDAIERSELIEVVQRQPALQNNPGAEWNYNNTGYGLLTVVVERVTGQGFPDWMEENVFRPLGMDDTLVRRDRMSIVPNSAQGYAMAEDGGYGEAADLGGSMGAGGIYTTVGDLAKWMDNLGSGEHGGKDVIAKMTTPYELTNGSSTGYGFGLFIDEQGGLKRIQHGGADTAHRSHFMYFPELDAGVIAQSNNAEFDGSIAARTADAFFEKEMQAANDAETEPERAPEEEDATEAFDPAAFEPETFDAFVGRYEMEEVPGFVLEFTREGEQYYLQATNQPKIEIFPIAPNAFDLRVVEASVVFHENEDGEVETLTLNQNGAHPAKRLADKPWSPSEEELAAYTGRYFSEELVTFYDIVVENGKLVLKHRRLEPIALTASKPDRFTGEMPVALCEFERNESGKVVSLLASNGRTRDVRFEKVE
jgi:CubicO group peptidase (beta-lactamase class C family)